MKTSYVIGAVTYRVQLGDPSKRFQFNVSIKLPVNGFYSFLTLHLHKSCQWWGDINIYYGVCAARQHYDSALI